MFTFWNQYITVIIIVKNMSIFEGHKQLNVIFFLSFDLIFFWGGGTWNKSIGLINLLIFYLYVKRPFIFIILINYILKSGTNCAFQRIKYMKHYTSLFNITWMVLVTSTISLGSLLYNVVDGWFCMEIIVYWPS